MRGMLLLFVTAFLLNPSPGFTQQITFRWQRPAATVCPTEFAEIDRKLAGARPPVLARSEKIPLKNKVLDLDRLRKVTQVFDLNRGPSDALANLQNGNYIYSIDTENRLVFMPRAIDPGAGVDLKHEGATFLGSHEGINLFLKARFGVNPEFVSAGEFVVRDGRVTMLSNGAGSYRGSTESLEYASKEFRSAGFSVNSRTEKRDYSVKKYPDPHGLAPGQARAEILANREPGFIAVLREIRQVMRAVDEIFPETTDLAQAAIATKDFNEKMNLLQAIGVVAQWQSPLEAEAFVIKNGKASLGEDKFNDSINALKSLLKRHSAPKQPEKARTD